MTALDINEEIALSGKQAHLFIEALNRPQYIMDKRHLRTILSYDIAYDFCHINGVSVIIEFKPSQKSYASITFATEHKENIGGALEGLIAMTGFNGLSFPQ
ncbi:MAG: hypothetical protein AABX16_03650 [Nanoarchaeota archaeon]